MGFLIIIVNLLFAFNTQFHTIYNRFNRLVINCIAQNSQPAERLLCCIGLSAYRATQRMEVAPHTIIISTVKDLFCPFTICMFHSITPFIRKSDSFPKYYSIFSVSFLLQPGCTYG